MTVGKRPAGPNAWRQRHIGTPFAPERSFKWKFVCQDSKVENQEGQIHQPKHIVRQGPKTKSWTRKKTQNWLGNATTQHLNKKKK